MLRGMGIDHGLFQMDWCLAFRCVGDVLLELLGEVYVSSVDDGEIRPAPRLLVQ